MVSEEALRKAHTYVELNFGRSYLSPAEEKRMNYLMCRGIHGDCTLYFTEGILKNPSGTITSTSMPNVSAIRTYGSIMTSTGLRNGIFPC